MSSLEIAELTGKRHADVMRDIRVMLEGLGLPLSNFASWYHAGNGRREPCYHLPKRETLILVLGYSVTMRAAIIDRWQELGAQVAQVVVRTHERQQLPRLTADIGIFPAH